MVTNEVLTGMAISMLVAAMVPVVAYVLLRRGRVLPVRNILLGVAVFVVFALALEGAMHAYLLQGNAQTKAWFAANPLGAAIYAALAAAVFEETGRYLGLRFLAKRVAGLGTPLSYSIGHGGVECLMIALTIGVSLFLGYYLATGQLDSLHLSAEVTNQVRAGFEGATFATSLLGGFERVSAFIFHMGWSLLVWKAVISRNGLYFLLALAGHFLLDFPAGLYQQKLLPITIGELEVLYGSVAVLILAAMWAFAGRGDAQHRKLEQTGDV